MKRPRPAHADPTLWDYTGSGYDQHGQRYAWDVTIVSPYDPHPIAHRAVDGAPEVNQFVWWTACGSAASSDAVERGMVDPRHAAQFALPCRRCWPEAGPVSTTARRYPEEWLDLLEDARIRCYDPGYDGEPYSDLLTAAEDLMAVIVDEGFER